MSASCELVALAGDHPGFGRFLECTTCGDLVAVPIEQLEPGVCPPKHPQS